MAVPKIAVIALVVIVAAPIMLGYAMNLNETTVIDYKTNNDAVNVTQLLQVGSDWGYAFGDPYRMNGNISAAIIPYSDITNIPIYNTYTSTNTSIPLRDLYDPEYAGDTTYISGLEFFEFQLDYEYLNGSQYVTAVLYTDDNTVLNTFTSLVGLHWDSSTNTIQYYNLYGNNQVSAGSVTQPHFDHVTISLTGLTSVELHYYYSLKSGNFSYADLADGYYFKKNSGLPSTTGWDINLPENTISALLSVDLDSISSSNYTMIIEDHDPYLPLQLIKTTTGGVVSWKVQKGTTVLDLYYNPDISDNTYQILLTDEGESGYFHAGHAQFRYIGSWPKIIGEANYYQTYDIDYVSQDGPTLESINIRANDGTTSRTPTIRIDAAKFRAFEYPVIEGSLEPAAFKTNPSTSINNIQTYGTQIIFGGHTYNVVNGNITIGTHQVSVRGVVFDSIPNDDQTAYINRINGTAVSTSADPSDIEFVGKWIASVSVCSMDQTTITKTEWSAGEFAWDGIDDNFLMAGLLTSLGVFIALGIYSRRSKASVWPLMLVAGGATFLFLIMM